VILIMAGATLWWFLGLFLVLVVIVWAMGMVGGLLDGYNRGYARARADMEPDDTLIWFSPPGGPPEFDETGYLLERAEQRLGRLNQ
jgi:hypothetical protein